VNNAGIGAQGTVKDAPDEEWRRVLDVNVVGAARVSRAACLVLNNRTQVRAFSKYR
jgi:NAD(P)-dependent dehydrogenase (short-subunit alcohol dehydrogenase family)